MGIMKLLLTPVSELLGTKPATEKERIGRSYQVPRRLEPIVLDMIEQASMAEERGRGGVLAANRKLWRLLNERCPETKEGRWKIRMNNSLGVFVEEQL